MNEKKYFSAKIIEASAGTGKTRYITDEIFRIYERYKTPEILKRILAITFSEKAAIEMKERFLKKIFDEVYRNLDIKERVELENVLLKLQISTIHSYCQTLLRRFYFLSDIDPYFEIIEKGISGVLFNKAIYRVLNSEGGKNNFKEISKRFKLNHFKNILFSFLNLHPQIFLGEAEGEITEKLKLLYDEISKHHSILKKMSSYLDFDDLEKITYEILEKNPEALVILEDFDENVNFVFIDEFQDTNLLQWEIVKKLIEEWLSGYGAKAESGEEFGILIVGDRKQSIYRFRGAESKLFDEAKRTLSDYLEEKILTKNYRSSEKIINFVNDIFDKKSPWDTQKLVVSEKYKNISSKIEINIFTGEDDKKLKKEEYEWVCKKIVKMIENKIPVFENGKERPIEFRDIAILMRKRKGKFFKMMENLLTDYGIPYVIIGGVGFYQEEEIIMLLSLFFALVDPSDKFSLWNIENSILEMDGKEIEEWRKILGKMNIIEVIEKIFEEKKVWEKLSIQQRANCEKFLMLLNQQRKLPLFQIAQNLREIAEKFEEPKADIFSIHQNAVKINTIHGAKGLEFPCVFLINLEDGGGNTKRNDIVYVKEEGKDCYSYSLSFEGEGFKKIFKKDNQEEEERLLYVALTRASQYLFVSGLKREKSNGLWINMIDKFSKEYKAEEISERIEKIKRKGEKIKGEIEIPVDFIKLVSYTEEKGSFKETEKTEMGVVIHKVLQEISEGKINFTKENFYKRTEFYIKKRMHNWKKQMKEVENIIDRIEENKEIKEIILKKGFVELPFVYPEDNGKIFEGRIDKVIVEGEKGKIYDYKLNVRETDMSNYLKQLSIYEKAVKNIFNVEKVEKFIISLEEGKIYKV